MGRREYSPRYKFPCLSVTFDNLPLVAAARFSTRIRIFKPSPTKKRDFTRDLNSSKNPNLYSKLVLQYYYFVFTCIWYQIDGSFTLVYSSIRHSKNACRRLSRCFIPDRSNDLGHSCIVTSDSNVTARVSLHANRLCLVFKNFSKKCYGSHHIESCDTCIEH